MPVSAIPTLEAVLSKYKPVDRTPAKKRRTVATIKAEFAADLMTNHEQVKLARTPEQLRASVSKKWVAPTTTDPSLLRVTPRLGGGLLKVDGKAVEATVADTEEAGQFLWDVQIMLDHGMLDSAFEAELAKRNSKS